MTQSFNAISPVHEIPLHDVLAIREQIAVRTERGEDLSLIHI